MTNEEKISVEVIKKRFMSASDVYGNHLAALYRADVGYLLAVMADNHTRSDVNQELVDALEEVRCHMNDSMPLPLSVCNKVNEALAKHKAGVRQ